MYQAEYIRFVHKIRLGFVLLAFVFGSFSFPVETWAASSGYTALITSVIYPKQLKKGEMGQVSVSVKNIGTATWSASGKNFVSVYSWDPIRKIEKNSIFSTPGWSTQQRAVRITKDVKPNGTVTLQFPIQTTMIGTIKESFSLTAENLARMKSGSFDLEVSVSDKGVVTVPVPSVSTPNVSSAPSATGDLLGIGTKPDWTAELVSKGGSQWQVLPNDKVSVTLQFKNTSQHTWSNSGANYLSVYAVDTNRKERPSLFRVSNWITSSHPAKMVEAEVKPGGIGTFRFDIQAPFQPGNYTESFQLSAENMAWIGGGSASLPIAVPITSQVISKGIPNFDGYKDSYTVEELAAKKKSDYMANLLLKSVDVLKLLGNGSQQVTLGFKNLGAATWNSHSLHLQGLEPAPAKLSYVRDDTWISAGEPVVVNAVTRPGEIAFTTFRIKAPPQKGNYLVSFSLQADGKDVDGGEIDIPITVTADGYIEPTPIPTKSPTPTTTPTPSTPSTPPASSQPSLNPVPLNGDESSLPTEPNIRVGLYVPSDDSMTVAPMTAAINVVNGGTTVCQVAIGEQVTVRYVRSSKNYVLSGGSCSGSSATFYDLLAEDGIAPMEITSYSHPIAWLTGSNDNKFRAKLELRFSPSTGDTWVINELPIESYLKGIAETSNSSPQEFQRTLLTAARTYALYHTQRQSKHAATFYYVDATYDQVYRGYASEARTNNVVAAVDATRGQVVTYAGQLAITPYFSRSDGRTRSWNEVWGGTSPAWITSVPVPWDQGKTLWGHGVGLSASGALGMARDGQSYDAILKYFFRGIELRKAYK